MLVFFSLKRQLALSVQTFGAAAEPKEQNRQSPEKKFSSTFFKRRQGAGQSPAAFPRKGREKMSANTVISTVDNITLVTLVGFPAQVDSIAKIFESIAQYDINIDMISMAPTHGAFTGLSFTISDNDLVDVLAFTTRLKQETQVNVIVSSVNHKISEIGRAHV